MQATKEDLRNKINDATAWIILFTFIFTLAIFILIDLTSDKLQTIQATQHALVIARLDSVIKIVTDMRSMGWTVQIIDNSTGEGFNLWIDK